MSDVSIYREIIIQPDTLARIWNEQQRFIVFSGSIEIQRGDTLQMSLAPGRLNLSRQDEQPILVLVTFVTSHGQPAGQVVVGFETIAHWTDDHLHGLHASGWEGRATRSIGRTARTRPHPQQPEIDRLVKLIKENSIANAPIAMLKRCGDFRRELRAICPDHPILRGLKDDH